jgi:hypothetical protein
MHGRRFAKRDRDLTISALRERGRTAEEVVQLALHWAKGSGGAIS